MPCLFPSSFPLAWLGFGTHTNQLSQSTSGADTDDKAPGLEVILVAGLQQTICQGFGDDLIADLGSSGHDEPGELGPVVGNKAYNGSSQPYNSEGRTS